MTTVWLITGTSSGFGRELVLIALERGDRVIATGRSLDKIQDFPKSDNIRTLELDLDWDTKSIKDKVDEAVAFWGYIDVIVNNAGFGKKGLIEEVGSEGFKEQFQTNFFGLIDVTNAVLPHMRARRSGTLVMLGSRTSWTPEYSGVGPYSASKAAVRIFSETLAQELRSFSIRVLIVEPAMFRTEAVTNNPVYVDNPIPDYDTLREETIKRYEIINGKMDGDPHKAMDVVYKVVKGEGNASGRPWPLYLLLGKLTKPAVKEKCEKILDVAEKWEDVTRNLEFDEK